MHKAFLANICGTLIQHREHDGIRDWYVACPQCREEKVFRDWFWMWAEIGQSYADDQETRHA